MILWPFFGSHFQIQGGFLDCGILAHNLVLYEREWRNQYKNWTVVRFWAGTGYFIFSKGCRPVNRLWIPPPSCIQSVPGVEGPIPGGKAACPWNWPFKSMYFRIKKDWSHNFTPHAFYVLHRDNFILLVPIASCWAHVNGSALIAGNFGVSWPDITHITHTAHILTFNILSNKFTQ